MSLTKKTSPAVFARVFLILLAFLLSFQCAGQDSGAGIFINSTRLIFPSSSGMSSLQIYNANDYPVMVQSWVDEGDENAIPENIQVPFVVVPPLFRLQPEESRTVKIIYTRKPLPGNKESVFWFNAQMIPPQVSRTHSGTQLYNSIDVSVRIRQKIFFRPDFLKGGSAEWTQKIRCDMPVFISVSHQSMKCFNPTPYYATIDKVKWHDENNVYITSGGMIAPFSNETFIVKDINPVNNSRMAYTELFLIGDTGEIIQVRKDSKGKSG